MTERVNLTDEPVSAPTNEQTRSRRGLAVKLTLPVEEFVLEETLEAVPNAEFECKRVVASGDGAVMPLIWVRTTDHESLETALGNDPSVESASLLVAFGAERLYRVHWADNVRLFVKMLTNSTATILSLHGTVQGWSLRVLYSSRDHFSTTYDFCESHNVTPDIQVIREFDGDDEGLSGLTAKQFEALKVAHEHGYYQVPRRADLENLAGELDISHQALSERLRRAHEALVEDTLRIGSPPG